MIARTWRGWTADAAFGVYIHWPFCAAKCPYCDFNSHVRHRPIDQARYARALAAEIAASAGRAPGRVVSSVFFGGGTPSLMMPETVGTVLDAIAGAWRIDPDVEVTLEANPSSVEADRFAGFRAAGVNRVSIGVQAMDDDALRRLGRIHSAADAAAALAIAERTFERFSFDLIYARPDHTPAMWRRELQAALLRAGEHLSLYQLTIEQGTPYAALHAAGKLAMPDEECSRAFWDITQEQCAAAGMPAYEISNHARAGAESRHNLVYWRYGEYAGIGPGAHGRLVQDGVRRALSTERMPEIWLERVESTGDGVIEEEFLSAEAEGDEYLLMGLRLSEGISRERFRALSGREIDDGRIVDLEGEGMVQRLGNDRLRVTAMGLPVLNAVVASLAA